MPEIDERGREAKTVRLAPLPVPVANPVFRPIRKKRHIARSISIFALIPLFYAALLFLGGIVLAHFVYLRPAWLLMGLLPLGLTAVVAILRAPQLRWLPIAFVWVVLGAWSEETEPIPAPNPEIAQLSDGLLRTIEGTVADAGPLRELRVENEDRDDSGSDTTQSGPGEVVQRVDLQLAAAEVVTDNSDGLVPIHDPVAARIRLTIHSPASPILCGQRLRAVLRILPVDTFHDPGVWDQAAYLETQEVTASGHLSAGKRDGDQLRLALLGEPQNSPACLLNRWRDAASTRMLTLPQLTRGLPKALRANADDAAMLTALVTGDRSFLTRSLRVGFERTGSFHLIVVSGVHLAILAGCVVVLARKLRFPRLPATLLTLAVSLAYALFTGFAVPVQRSFWMVALYLAGRLIYRERSPLNVIGFATLCLAAASPRSIFDASLQMTLLAVTAIAGVAVPLLENTLSAYARATKDLRLISLDPKLPPRIAQFRVMLRLMARHLEPATNTWFSWKALPFAIRAVLRLGELIFITFVVELALALPMAMYFHRITEYALGVNLCILPLLAVLVPAAMLLTVLLAIWPAVALLPAALCLAILHFSLFVVRGLGGLVFGDVRVPEPALAQIAVAFFCFLLAVQMARMPGIARRLSLAPLACMAVAALWPRPVDHPQEALLFEAIDVGQGDSLLLISPDGKSLLVDAGGIGLAFLSSRTHHAGAEFDVGEEVVSEALWARGIRRLDAVALTHAHHDHMGGLPAILRNFRPRELWVGNNPRVPAYLDVLREAAALGIPLRSLHAGDETRLGTVRIEVFAPVAAYHPGPQPGNNDSLVLQARFGDQAVLLAGDAEAPEEKTMLAENTPNAALSAENPRTSLDLHSVLLKIGHHGSLTSTRPGFLAAVAPQWAVISCGRRNRFGHPRPEILAELQSAHVRTYRTDLGGVTCFLLDGKTVTAEPLCRAP